MNQPGSPGNPYPPGHNPQQHQQGYPQQQQQGHPQHQQQHQHQQHQQHQQGYPQQHQQGYPQQQQQAGWGHPPQGAGPQAYGGQQGGMARTAEGYVPCPKCGSVNVDRPSFTWWGGYVGPKFICHVKCLQCSHAYNGNNGGSNTAKIAMYYVIVTVLVIIVIAIANA